MATLTGKIVADFRTSLATELAVGGTTATLQSATDDDGVALPAGNYYFTIDGNSSQKEHFAATLSGTSLTAIKSVSRQGVQTSGAVRKHRIGASVTITDFAHIQVINDLINGTTDLNSADPLKYDGTATISNDAHLATKKYVDDTAVAGAPDATTSVKGNVEIATGAELAAGTGTGGTGATVVAAGSSFTNTPAGAADENKVPVLDAAGRLDEDFLPVIISKTADGIQVTTDPDSANDAVRKLYVDNLSIGTGTAGETIVLGQALYIKASDGKLYKAVATSDEATFSFVGIALSDADADATVTYARPGERVSGLTGLTTGAIYYIGSTAGTLSATPDSTRFAKVARAISTTEVIVLEPKFIISGSQVASAVTTYAQTCGFYPARVELKAGCTSVGGQIAGLSLGNDTNTCVYQTYTVGDPGFNASNAWFAKNSAGSTNRGTVTTKTSTGFTLACLQASLSTTIYWTAYSE